MPLTDYIPDFNLGNIDLIVTFFAVVILLVIFLSVGGYFFIRHVKFNKNITILEDVSGSDDLEPIGKDKAMTVRVGRGGLEILFLKRRKVYRGSYGKRMGKNNYTFAIGPDGYWYNVTLGSLQDGMDKVNIKPTAVNMRYQNEALQELIKARYDQPSFWNKYGPMILTMGFLAFIAVMAWFMFDAFKDAAGAVEQGAEVTKQTAELLKQVVGGIESIKATGGFTQVGV